MDDLLEQFLLEGRELVQQAADDLLALERSPKDAARLDSLFRAVHTLKGSVGLFELVPMAQALHAAEDALAALRAGSWAPGADGFRALLACMAACQEWIEDFALAGALPATAATVSAGLVAALRQAPPAAAAWLAPLQAGAGEALAKAWAAGQQVVALRYVPRADCFFLGEDPLALARSVPALLALELRGQAPWDGTASDPYRCNLVLELLSAAPAEALQRLFRFVADQVTLVPLQAATAAPVSSPVMPREDAATAGSLRVDAAKVDALVDLVGELAVAKNALTHLLAAAEAGTAVAQAFAVQRLELETLVGRLHRAAMELRLTPLARTLRRFPLMVRGLAAQLGKTVAFEVEGDQLEADRVVVDGIAEPLLHLLRNALDHGIELPAQRLAAGKPAVGTVRLLAQPDGERLRISVADDGAGMDPARLRQVALARGLASADVLADMDDASSLDLIFLPGFSSAGAVTDISGRGVGMDAVRSAVQALGGRLQVASTPGGGTTFTLSLPQSLSLTAVVTVSAGGERFGVPLQVVAETLSLPAASVHPLRDGEAFVWRGQTVPLLRLAALLGRPVQPRGGGACKVLVVRVAGHPVGLEVDAVRDWLNLAMRPPTGLLAQMRGVLGTALLGDGRVLLVLDIAGLLA